MSLTDAQVAEIAGMTTGTSLGGRARDLAREVQASRKLIAELRALQPKGTRGSLHYGGSNQALLAVRRMIEEAGL